MHRFYNIVQTYKEYFVFALLLAISISLLAFNDNKQIKQLRTLSLGVVGTVQTGISAVPNIFELQKENEMLRRMNMSLADEVSQLREARLENIRLRKLLELKQNFHYPLIAAKVVGKSLHLLRNTITLDVGEKDGVRTSMPIVNEYGLVGKIIAASSRYSVGQLVINRDFRATSKIQRSRVDGILQWDGSSYSVLKNVAKTLDVKQGDVVETSEYSSAFPPAIRIGVVVSVTEQPGNLFKKIEVENAVDFAKLEEVFVVKFTPDPDRITLEAKSSGK